MKTWRSQARATLALTALLTAPGSTFAHGLMTDPPARNAFCGYITKPDQVANGNAQYPICGQAFNATGLNPQAGYSFMAVLTHTLGYSVVGARVGSSRVDLQACKLEYSIVSPK